jgi:hypothetical protein
MEAVIQRLTEQRAVSREHEDYNSSAVGDFVPILVERVVRTELARRGA